LGLGVRRVRKKTLGRKKGWGERKENVEKRERKASFGNEEKRGLRLGLELG
jgi:hypothetical protein